jgi:hypothetical protein
MPTKISKHVAKLYMDEGLSEVCNAGAAVMHGEWVLLRGITDAELSQIVGGERGAITAGVSEQYEMGDLRKCEVFEVVAKGEAVSERIVVGHHCRPVAVAMDPMQSSWKTDHARARDRHIPMTWDPAEVEGFALDLAIAKENKRRKKNGLPSVDKLED